MRRAWALLTAALMLVIVGACTDSPQESRDAEPGTTTAEGPIEEEPQLSGDLIVFAAASLSATFTQIAEEFEQLYPGVSITLNFAGSSDLVSQLTEGAPADILATADQRTMTNAVDAETIASDPEVFATNTLQIVVAPDNPAGIENLADLADPDLRVVVCAPQVPCGAATVTVLEAAGVDLNPVSEENAVTDVLGKVTSGEADAGLVYVTDVQGAGDAALGVDFEESAEVVNAYPIALTAHSTQQEAAQAFIDYVLGEAGQATLSEAGFRSP